MSAYEMTTAQQEALKANNPVLAENLEALEVMRAMRGKIALAAAEQIVSEGGVTTNLPLYYTSICGRTGAEGRAEQDIKLLDPAYITGRLAEQTQPGQPIRIDTYTSEYSRAPWLAPKIGLIDSFSTETFEPVRLEVKMMCRPPRGEAQNGGFYSWRNAVALAVREVVRDGTTYRIADEVSRIAVYSSLTQMTPETGLELDPSPNGAHIAIGEEAYAYEKLDPPHEFSDARALWLANTLTPNPDVQI